MVSSWVADLFSTPGAQIAVIVVCAAWFLIGWNPNILTAVLSILAITLTQMVLNQQKAREQDAHRRDVAMHAKLDELLIASKAARNEMAGIEDLEEEEIEVLKEEAKQAIDEAGAQAGDAAERATAKKAVDQAINAETKAKRAPKPKPRKPRATVAAAK